jgi:hypothetical protein
MRKRKQEVVEEEEQEEVEEVCEKVFNPIERLTVNIALILGIRYSTRRYKQTS